MASGWESDVCRFEPWHLQATFEPGLLKQHSSQPLFAFNEGKILLYFKRLKKPQLTQIHEA